MAFYNFPHTRNYDTDLGYLIKQYKDLLKDYGVISDYLQKLKVIGAIESNVKFFNTCKDMKEFEELEFNDYAITCGYHSINDNGHGLYKIINIEPSAVHERLNNGLYAVLIDHDYRAEVLGLYGDGVHNDTEALQNAINRVDNLLLTKTYLITNTLQGKSDVTITGGGTIHFVGELNNLITFDDCSNVLLKDLSIIGDGVTYTESRGDKGIILLQRCSNIIVDNVHISDCYGNAIQGYNSSKCIIQNCYITNVSDNGIMFGGDGANNNMITSNYIKQTKFQNGIFVTASPNSTTTDKYIYGNVITNNYVSDSGDTGIESGIHTVDTIISDNIIEQTSVNPSILLRDSKRVKAVNNSITTIGTRRGSAISVVPQTEPNTYDNEAIITGNTIVGNFDSGFIKIQQSGVIVDNNSVDATANVPSAILIGGSLSNITIGNIHTNGTFTNIIDFNFEAAAKTLTNIKMTCPVLSSKVNIWNVVFVDSSLWFKYSKKSDTVARYTGYNIISKNSRYNLLHGSLLIKSSEGLDMADFVTDGSSVVTIAKSTNIGSASGFEGWSISMNGENLYVQRRGADVTNATIEIKLSN